MHIRVICTRCRKEREGMEVTCNRCGGPFKLDIDLPFSKEIRLNFPYIKEWVSLGEWNSPMIKGDLFYKLDFMNPTGSYKDRGSTTMISYLKQSGIKEIAEDSSGNAGASVAAYGAAAGMKVSIFVPSTARGNKVRQIQAYGASIVKVEGNRDDVSRAARESGLYHASHILQPHFRDGIRSLAYEIVRDLGWRKPEDVYVPVSAGTLLLGMYEGFRHMANEGVIKEIPKIVAVQTEQVSPLCAKINHVNYNPPEKLTSIADALVSTNPILLPEMINAIKDGECVTVSDQEVLEAWKILARKGLLVEYSSATTLAGYMKNKGSNNAVLVLTGSGLKTLS
ncbi:pyridoxal-phosphate dependent enzyme [Sulfuracidifex metallicus]|uniref:pyridoxal-phosphate dependent enzyme n=1 Tax=Sulfuracidifex metallicus TaxID=47303 RepID=UPI002272AFE1|nr:pyridoxal-phosphate dependent enzyme [Sulfuracidifex metallicus]MCY0849231.1 pyridoxal-phosphate dependent enzyme [Sulfuracidifex metallicus]